MEQKIAAIEARVDAAFSAVTLPTGDLNTARWILSAVAEDSFRLYLNSVMSKTSRLELGQLVGFVDRGKYSLRYALELAEKKLPPTTAVGPIGLTEKLGTIGHEALRASDEYALAVRLFSTHHSGQRPLRVDLHSGEAEPLSDMQNTQYNSLEFLLHSDSGLFSPLTYVAELFRSADGRAYPYARNVILQQILRSAELRQGRVRYTPDKKAMAELFDVFNVPQTPGPSTWEFPWSGLREAGRFYAALQSICAYHLFAIHFSAKGKISGAGVSQICFNTNSKALERMISDIARLPIAAVRKIIDFLALGSSTTSPDPALQPLIPIGGNRFAIPSFNVLSSNWVRNMLTLHARIDNASFDKQSKIFELEMTEQMLKSIGRPFVAIPNAHLPTKDRKEEVDIVLVSLDKNELLLCELRWVLQPGDAREVINKRKELLKKVDQIERKVEKVRRNLPAVLSALKLPAGPWTVNGMVVMEGYGGLKSSKPDDYPIVPLKVAVAALNSSASLTEIHSMLASLAWLPRPDTDFVLRFQSEQVLGEKFKVPSLDLGTRAFLPNSLEIYMAEGFEAITAKVTSRGTAQ